MCFRNRGRKKKNIDWHINTQKIEHVNDIKYLGYLFNENNNHNKHIDTQIKKAKRIIYIYNLERNQESKAQRFK